MASGNNPNNNSLQPHNQYLFSPQQYLANRQWILQQAAHLEEVNKRGVEQYLQVQRELQRKAQEGERARLQLEYLEQLNLARQIAAPAPLHNYKGSYMSNNQYQATSAPAAHAVVNPSNVFAMNVQGTSPQNLRNANSTPYMEQTASSSRPQSGFNSEIPIRNSPNAPHIAHPSVSNARFQPSQVQQGNNQSPYPPSSTSSNINPMQHLARHPLSRGIPSTSGSASHNQYPVRQDEYGAGPSNLQTQEVRIQRPVDQPIFRRVPVSTNVAIPSSAGSSGMGSSNQVPGSSSRNNTNYTLSGALGEKSAFHDPNPHGDSSGILIPPEKDFWALTSSDSKAPSTNTLAQAAPISLPVKESQSSSSSTGAARSSTSSVLQAAIPNPAAKNDNSAATSASQPQLPVGVNRVPLANAAQAEHVANMFEQLLGNDIRAGALDNRQETGQAPNATNSPNEMKLGEALNKSASILQSWNNFKATRNVAFNAPIGDTSSKNSQSEIYGTSTVTSTAAPHPLNRTFSQTVAGSSQQTGAYSNSILVPPVYNSDSSAPEPKGGASGESSSFSLGVRETKRPQTQYPPTQYSTPPPEVNKPFIPITPASANKKTLARDILRALSWSSRKRKASTPPSSPDDEEVEPAAKKQAIGPMSMDPPPTDGSLFGRPGLFDIPLLFTVGKLPPPTSESVGTATIEEVQSATIQEVADGPVADDQIINVSPSPIPVSGGGEDMPPTSETDAPSIPEPPPATSAAESIVSSPDAQREDTALWSFKEDLSNPLFLPEPDSPKEIPAPSSREKKGKQKAAHPLEIGQKSYNVPFYIEVPVLTAAQRNKFLKGKTTANNTGEQANASSTLLPVRSNEIDSPRNAEFDEEKRLRTAYKDSEMRLRARPCLWNDCQFVANCAKSLRAHVAEHADLTTYKSPAASFPCWWGDCIGKFISPESLLKHLRNHHIYWSIPCIHQGCDEELKGPQRLLNHLKTNHTQSNTLRPYVNPFIPPQRTLPSLETMPAYNVIHLPVTCARMSKEDRARIGPWVARNCFGPVSIAVPMLNARNQVTRRRPDENNQVLGSWHDKYNFADQYGVKYPSRASDLESSKTTEDIQAGLFLAPDIAGSRGPLQEQLFTSLADRIKIRDPEKYSVRVERNSEETEPEIEPSEIKIEEAQLDLSQAPPSSASQEPHQHVEHSYNDLHGLGVMVSQKVASDGQA